MNIGGSEWDLFNLTIKDFGIPEVDPASFAAAPADVRAFCHRLSGDALRDVFQAYQIMVAPDNEPERYVEVLRRFVSSGHQGGAPWADDASVRTIHEEYVDSIDWGTGPGDSTSSTP